MLCKEHQHGMFNSAGGPCSQCGNQTYSQYALCERCSVGFDQCECCRAPLNSGRHPLLIAAFNSPEVAEALKTLREADETKHLAFRAAAAIFQAASEPARSRLVAALKPFQEKLAAQEKPFVDEYVAVGDKMTALEQDRKATAGQRLDARNAWSAAMNKCSASCRPFRDQFDADIQPLNQRFQQEVAAFEAIRAAACEKASSECETAKAKANEIIVAKLSYAGSLRARVGYRLRSFLRS